MVISDYAECKEYESDAIENNGVGWVVRGGSSKESYI